MKAILSVLTIIFVSVCGYSQHPITVLYIGDSVTDGGWGRSGGSAQASAQRNKSDLNHLYGHGYMEMSAAVIMSETPGKYVCHNRGISGNTLDDLVERWQDDCISLNPDVISILIGTNDIEVSLKDNGSDFNVKEWSQKYENLIQSTMCALPDVRIMLCTPFVAKVGKRGEQNNFALRDSLINECISVVQDLAAKYDTTLVPFDELIEGLISSPQDSPYRVDASYWVWDGIHPTTPCHKKMADLWVECFLSVYASDKHQ